MRIATANNNRRRLVRRARRAAAIKRLARRMGVGLFPEERPWFSFAPDGHYAQYVEDMKRSSGFEAYLQEHL
jgi:hypothetical protein